MQLVLEFGKEELVKGMGELLEDECIESQKAMPQRIFSSALFAFLKMIAPLEPSRHRDIQQMGS